MVMPLFDQSVKPTVKPLQVVSIKRSQWWSQILRCNCIYLQCTQPCFSAQRRNQTAGSRFVAGSSKPLFQLHLSQMLSLP